MGSTFLSIKDRPVGRLLKAHSRCEYLIQGAFATRREIADTLWRRGSTATTAPKISAQAFRRGRTKVDLKGFREAAGLALEFIPSGLPMTFTAAALIEDDSARRKLRMLDRKITALQTRMEQLLEEILETEPSCRTEALEKAKFLCAIVAGVPGIELDYFILMIAECLEIATEG